MLRVIGCVVGAIVIILLYEMIGIFAAYKKQPELSEETKQGLHPEEIYTDATVEERACIIEENGDALLQRVRLIEQAKEDIVLSTFAFHDDDSGQIMMDALLRAAERNVHIRILLDGFESWTAMEGNAYFYAMSSHPNIEIKVYNRANPLKPWDMMGRMHDKYLIADGKTYILGGRNTYNYFLGEFPGHKNYDRDVLVVCENPQADSSVNQLLVYFETIWSQKDCKYFHDKEKLADRKSVKQAKEDVQTAFATYYDAQKDTITDTDFEKDTVVTDKIMLISNPIHTGAKEPTAWYEMGVLMKQAKKRVKIHTPYIICNDMMYDTWSDVAANVPEFTVMTNSVANNGNPFGSADYQKNRDRISSTGVTIWEYFDRR